MKCGDIIIIILYIGRGMEFEMRNNSDDKTEYNDLVEDVFDRFKELQPFQQSNVSEKILKILDLYEKDPNQFVATFKPKDVAKGDDLKYYL